LFTAPKCLLLLSLLPFLNGTTLCYVKFIFIQHEAARRQVNRSLRTVRQICVRFEELFDYVAGGDEQFTPDVALRGG
jgi:hypothetical protein